MIELVISGGQRGADQAGWRAAKACGIRCGGFMPRGFLTETPDGRGKESHPEFAGLYGAKEHSSAQWPPRTRANVNWCDALIWFGDPKSRGGRLTLGICDELAVETPVAIVSKLAPSPFKSPENMASWLEIETPAILMVAGNRESSAAGSGAWVERYMLEVFRILAERG